MTQKWEMNNGISERVIKGKARRDGERKRGREDDKKEKGLTQTKVVFSKADKQVILLFDRKTTVSSGKGSEEEKRKRKTRNNKQEQARYKNE